LLGPSRWNKKRVNAQSVKMDRDKRTKEGGGTKSDSRKPGSDDRTQGETFKTGGRKDKGGGELLRGPKKLREKVTKENSERSVLEKPLQANQTGVKLGVHKKPEEARERESEEVSLLKGK